MFQAFVLGSADLLHPSEPSKGEHLQSTWPPSRSSFTHFLKLSHTCEGITQANVPADTASDICRASTRALVSSSPHASPRMACFSPLRFPGYSRDAKARPWPWPSLPPVPRPASRHIPATTARRQAPSKLGVEGEAAPGTLPPSPFSRSPPRSLSSAGSERRPAAGAGSPAANGPPSAAAPRSPGTGSRQRRRRPRPRAPRHAAISTAAPLPPQGRSGPGQRGAAEPPPGSPWLLPGGRSSSSSYLRVGN